MSLKGGEAPLHLAWPTKALSRNWRFGDRKGNPGLSVITRDPHLTAQGKRWVGASQFMEHQEPSFLSYTGTRQGSHPAHCRGRDSQQTGGSLTALHHCSVLTLTNAGSFYSFFGSAGETPSKTQACQRFSARIEGNGNRLFLASLRGPPQDPTTTTARQTEHRERGHTHTHTHSPPGPFLSW